ncbi:outer membrane lipoprotein chaperone LolA [Cognatazoarcus halotolerans]|uniref:outer membrane lipoprotein chaperone LolA n=1 Tax=Cognatazoarcus halotolerans TaxID=2686016 RepID=UPI00190F145E|nr:outer membrane lipoprotein chaperone LolA [Cognatazoarcus halotolerans]MCB1900352.1 outer membrane lipoprotein chaperone LolA [Rhodocyclaceae bacterium]
MMPIVLRFRLLLLSVVLLGSLQARAGGLDQLRQFVSQTSSGSGEFSQTVIPRSGRKPQVASGKFWFERPGRFRWSYEQPYQQLLVGDGERMWSYDRDLNQVTVKRMDDALGATPAAIIAGKAAIEKNFDLTEGAAADGLAWVDAKPKVEGGAFASLRLGFSESILKVMEISDNFGQNTRLVFERFEKNPRLSPELFRFTPPAGADVIGGE